LPRQTRKWNVEDMDKIDYVRDDSKVKVSIPPSFAVPIILDA